MEFQDLIASSPVEVKEQSEARFSFLEGGYVEESELQGLSLSQGPLYCHYNDLVQFMMHSLS